MAELRVRLTKKRYLTKLDTHAQYVRWLRAAPCWCIDQQGSINPDCPSCLGRGKIYSHQLHFDIWNERSPHAGTLVYPKFTPIIKVDSVMMKYGWNRDFRIVHTFADHVEIATTPELPVLPNKNNAIGVNYTYTKEIEYLDGPATYLGYDVLSVPLPPVKTIETEGVLGDIVKVRQVTNVTKGWMYGVTGFYKNQLFLDLSSGAPTPDTTDEWVVRVVYINPHKLLLNQMSERDKRDGTYIAVDGDANLTVPYEYYVGDGDIVIQLVGEQRGMAVLQMPDGMKVELPAFDVTQVLDVQDGTGKEYIQDRDFIIRGGNQMAWITDNQPEGKFSCTFLYHSAFSVFGIKPTVRTPENLRMPRRVSLRSFDKMNVNFDLHQLQEAAIPTGEVPT